MISTVDLTEDGAELALDESELTRTIEFVLGQEQVERPCFVSVTVCTDERMREINCEWRGVDAVTDVVSLECEGPWDEDLAPGEPCELGDIVLAPAYIERQAHRLHTTPEAETRLLVVHGILHLLGYDHIEEDEALEMEAREDELCALLAPGGYSHVRLTRHRGKDAP